MISRKEIEGSKYAYVIEKGLPDHIIEFFWYGFKDSIYNTIAQSDVPDQETDLVKAELESTREILNELQSQQKYDEISGIIQNFIIWISRHLMISFVKHYNFNIFVTNIKRWSKWILEKGDKLCYDWLKNYKKVGDDALGDHFYVFFEIKRFVYGRSIPEGDQILEFVFQYLPDKSCNNLAVLHQLMEYLVKNHILKPTLLEILNDCCPVIECLKTHQILPKDLKVIKPYSFIKLLKKYSMLNPKS